MRYKQAIRIGNNVTDIMKLPCISACVKLNDGNGFEWLQYQMKGRDNEQAEVGDWIIEDLSGQWHFVTDEEMKGKGVGNG